MFAGPETEPFPPRYWEPAHLAIFCLCHRVLFPGWTLRIYHDDRLDEPAGGRWLRVADRLGWVQLMFVERVQSDSRSMAWRMLPAFDPGVDVFVCRDTDALPSITERRAVDNWLASGCLCHSIIGHWAHVGVPLMGGLCGFRAPRLRLLLAAEGIHDLDSYTRGVQPDWMRDQRYLLERVWPLVNNDYYLSWVLTGREPVGIYSSAKHCEYGEPVCQITDVPPGTVIAAETDGRPTFLGGGLWENFYKALPAYLEALSPEDHEAWGMLEEARRAH